MSANLNPATLAALREENTRLTRENARKDRLISVLEGRLALNTGPAFPLGPLKTSGKTPLTDKQGDILDYVRLCGERNGMPPTNQEIATYFGFASVNAADQHLRALVTKGWLVRLPGKSRGLRVLP